MSDALGRRQSFYRGRQAFYSENSPNEEDGKRPLDSLAEETVPSPLASLLTSDEADGLTSLLDKLFRTQQQTGAQKANDEVLHVLTSKRGREHLAGAMPPINEFCRLMNVQCY